MGDMVSGMDDDKETTIARIDHVIHHLTVAIRFDSEIKSRAAEPATKAIPPSMIEAAAAIESLANARVALAGPWVEPEETSK